MWILCAYLVLGTLAYYLMRHLDSYGGPAPTREESVLLAVVSIAGWPLIGLIFVMLYDWSKKDE